MLTIYEGDSLEYAVPVTGPDGAPLDLAAAGATLTAAAHPVGAAGDAPVTGLTLTTDVASTAAVRYAAGALGPGIWTLETVIAMPPNRRQTRRDRLNVIPAI